MSGENIDDGVSDDMSPQDVFVALGARADDPAAPALGERIRVPAAGA